MSLTAEFGNFASSNMISEATAFKTVPPGGYTFQGTKIYETDPEKGFVRLGGKVMAGGLQRGMVFMKLQWKEERSASGKLRIACKLFGQALRALHPDATVEELTKIDATTLAEELMKYPINVFVGEYYQVPDPTSQYGSKRVNARTPEEVAAIRQQGGTPKNEVLSISPVRN